MPRERQARPRKVIAGLEKCPTGIQGLDEITNGGLPRGRPTLVCGGAGSGKTLLAMEFIVRGIRDYGEPGVFMAFEETTAAREQVELARAQGVNTEKGPTKKGSRSHADENR